VSTGDDLAQDALTAILGDRPVQSHQVLLSAAVTAGDWARSGIRHGAVVVADHQIVPRGRAGRPWTVTPGRGLSFALVLRPQFPATREGWLYVAVLMALADVCGDGVTIDWPDEIRRDGALVAAAGMEARPGGLTLKSAVVNVLITDAAPPRGELLRAVLEAIDARLAGAPEDVLGDYVPLCATIGRDLRVRLLGGAARLEGQAIEVLDDGALVLEIGDGRRVPVRPQDISSIDGADASAPPPG
jgi:BirA family biotin operon repressor/biotin-[acetyl-CoA-carboxylase] ligase